MRDEIKPRIKILVLFILAHSAFQPVDALNTHPGWPKETSFTAWNTPLIVNFNGEVMLFISSNVGTGGQQKYMEAASYFENGSKYIVHTISDACCFLSANVPAVGDIDDDGSPEAVFSARSGQLIIFETDGSTQTYTIMAGSTLYSPSIGDINGDEDLELILPSKDGRIYTMERLGDIIWTYDSEEEIVGPVALGEVDGDVLNGLEVIFATANGKLYALKNGAVLQNWPINVGSILVESPPTLADINNDGHIEVLIGTESGFVHAYDENGVEISGWPKQTSGPIEAPIVIGDIDGDTLPDIIAVVIDYGDVYAWDGSGAIFQGFPIRLGDLIRAPPLIFDIDGDTDVEILVGTLGGKIFSIEGDGSNQLVTQVKGNVLAPMSTGDIDSDEMLEISVGTSGDSSGLYLWDITAPALGSSMHWPSMRHDPHNTGMFGPVARINSPISGSIYSRLDNIQFSGVGLSSYGDISSYSWNSNITGLMSTSASYVGNLSLGVHEIILKVIDEDGREDTVSRNIEIVNIDPSCSIEDPQDGSSFTRLDNITFIGSASDPEGDTLEYKWSSSIDGNLNAPNPMNFSISGLSLGNHVINFTVSDEYGGECTASIELEIRNLAPSATITAPKTGKVYSEKSSISFRGSASDPEGDSMSYEWSSSIDGNLSTSKSFSTSDLSVGMHTITFTVVDEHGGRDSASIAIGVNPVKGISPPTAEISSPKNGSRFYDDEIVIFEGEASADATAYNWVSSIDGSIGSNLSIATDELSIGQHIITFTAINNHGLIDSDSIEIFILPLQIDVEIISPIHGAVYEEGAKVFFESYVEYPFDITPDYTWTSDLDGLLSNKSKFTTSVLKVGIHNISLLVTDGNRAAGRSKISIEIISKKKPGVSSTQKEPTSIIPPLGESLRRGLRETRKQLGNIVFESDKTKFLPVLIGIVSIIGWYLVLRKGSIMEYTKRFK
jgi:hypothetical protein